MTHLQAAIQEIRASITYWRSIAGDEYAATETRRMARKEVHRLVKLLLKAEKAEAAEK